MATIGSMTRSLKGTTSDRLDLLATWAWVIMTTKQGSSWKTAAVLGFVVCAFLIFAQLAQGEEAGEKDVEVREAGSNGEYEDVAQSAVEQSHPPDCEFQGEYLPNPGDVITWDDAGRSLLYVEDVTQPPCVLLNFELVDQPVESVQPDSRASDVLGNVDARPSEEEPENAPEISLGEQQANADGSNTVSETGADRTSDPDEPGTQDTTTRVEGLHADRIFEPEQSQPEPSGAKKSVWPILVALFLVSMALAATLGFLLQSELRNLMGIASKFIGGLRIDWLGNRESASSALPLLGKRSAVEPPEIKLQEEPPVKQSELADLHTTLGEISNERDSLRASVGSLQEAYRWVLEQSEPSRLMRELLVIEATLGCKTQSQTSERLDAALRRIDEHFSHPQYSAGSTVPLMVDAGTLLFRHLTELGCAPRQCSQFGQEVAEVMNERTVGTFNIVVPRPGNLVEPSQMQARGSGGNIRRVHNWAIYFQGDLQKKAMVDTI